MPSEAKTQREPSEIESILLDLQNQVQRNGEVASRLNGKSLLVSTSINTIPDNSEKQKESPYTSDLVGGLKMEVDKLRQVNNLLEATDAHFYHVLGG